MAVIIEVTIAATTSKQNGNKVLEENNFILNADIDFFSSKNSNSSIIQQELAIAKDSGILLYPKSYFNLILSLYE